MPRTRIASKLLAAATSSERRRLLSQLNEFAGETLARELKEVCYRQWASNPLGTRTTAAVLNQLARFRPTKEIEALALWVSGIADITLSRFSHAIQNLDKAALTFRSIHKDLDAAQARVAELIPLALTGDYKRARSVGKQALKVFERFSDELSAGKVEMNLSNIVSRQESHREAEKYCLSALKRFTKLGERIWQAMAENGLANTYAELGDFSRAHEFYGRALQTARGEGMLLTEAEIVASMGNLAQIRGKYSDGLKYLELSRRKYEELRMPHEMAIAGLEVADLYAELNLIPEAIAIYKPVIRSFSRMRLRSEEARARLNYARVMALNGKMGVAKRELATAGDLYRAEGNPVGRSSVLLALATIELADRNFSAALETSKSANRILKKGESTRKRLAGRWIEAEALLRLGKVREAERSLGQILRSARRNEQHNLGRSCYLSLGKIALERGDSKSALRSFGSAARISESMRAPLPEEDFRMAFFSNQLEAFEETSKIYISENRIWEAFEWAEKVRARSLVEVLENERAPDTESHKEREQLSSLRAELNWIYSRIDISGSEEAEKHQRRATRIEEAIETRMRRNRSASNLAPSAGMSAQGANSATSSISKRTLVKQIGLRRVLIEFVIFDQKISAFVLCEESVEYYRDLADVNKIRDLLDELRFQFGVLRYGTAAIGPFAEEMKRRSDKCLMDIYELLLHPIEHRFKAKDLVIVPTGVLHYVPFGALHDGHQYLIERSQVVLSPSASVWQLLDRKRMTPLRKAAFFGYAGEAIPMVNEEIRRLSRSFPDASGFTGQDATFSAYVENAEECDILHLACHGSFRPESPMFSSLHLADGWVTVQDICSQKLRAELVTLSACETGLSKVHPGEELLGLARGFLSAGAKSLVVTLWTVNDTAAVRLMTNFYRTLQQGLTPAAALREAQRKMIKKGEHPYFWSPFVLIGK